MSDSRNIQEHNQQQRPEMMQLLPTATNATITSKPTTNAIIPTTIWQPTIPSSILSESTNANARIK